MSNLDAKLDSFCYWSEQSLQKIAKAKAKSKKKKLDPKAKVRNRGTVCVPAERAKDKKDHFPINDADQARNALARVHQYDKVPPWYKGSLKGLQALVSKKVHSKYPGIGKSEKKTKKKSDFEFSLEKQGVLKEKIDESINEAARHIHSLSTMAEMGLRKLEELKSTYATHFDPELEYQLLGLLEGANLSDASSSIHKLVRGVHDLVMRARQAGQGQQATE